MYSGLLQNFGWLREMALRSVCNSV